MEELAAQVRAEHLKTGRVVTEILDAMRDEGYIDIDDADMIVCAALATPGEGAQFEALIARLKNAAEPDPELDLAIQIATSGNPWRWHVSFPADQRIITWDQYGVNAPGNPIVTLDPYTGSIDAALMLVPLEPANEPSGTWDWQLESTNGGMTISARIGPDDTRSFAETPAIAVCIAALRARAGQSVQ